MNKILVLVGLILFLDSAYAASNIFRSNAYNCEVSQIDTNLFESIEVRELEDKKIFEVINENKFTSFYGGQLHAYITGCTEEECTLVIFDDELVVQEFRLQNPQKDAVELKVVYGESDISLSCIDHGKSVLDREKERVIDKVEADAKKIEREAKRIAEQGKEAAKKAKAKAKELFDKF